MRVENAVIQPAVTIASGFTTPKIDITHMGFVAIQAVVTGSSPTGSLSVVASCDGVNFGPVSGISALAISAVGTQILNLSNVGFSSIKLVWAFTSGTGTIALTVNGKGF